MGTGRYGTWARSLLSPRERFLPGLGARLSGHPRLAAATLSLLSAAPEGRLRAALYRNVSRPLSRRLEATLQVPVVGGLRMLVDTRDVLGCSLATRRIWEPHVTRLFDEILEDGDVFVDVGAHVGYYSLIASRIVGCTGIVYALEPHPTTHRVLLANLALNRAQNVKPLAVAAGARHGRGSIASPRARDAAQMSLLGDNGDATAVSIAPLSELVDETHHPRLRLIKIDVEGFEDQVLQGLEPVLARGVRRAVLIEVHAHLNPGVRQPIAEFVGRTGLHAHLVQDDAGYDRTFRLPETAGLTPVTAEWIAHTELDHFELLLRSET